MNHWTKEHDLKLFAKILERFSHFGEGPYYLGKLCLLTDEEIEFIFERAKAITKQK